MAFSQAHKMSARLCSHFDIVAKDFFLLPYIIKRWLSNIWYIFWSHFFCKMIIVDIRN